MGGRESSCGTEGRTPRTLCTSRGAPACAYWRLRRPSLPPEAGIGAGGSLLLQAERSCGIESEIRPYSPCNRAPARGKRKLLQSSLREEVGTYWSTWNPTHGRAWETPLLKPDFERKRKTIKKKLYKKR